MYKSFAIRNFRCFPQLTIEPLTRINLVAGKNNVGKTALLEALWWHSGPDLPDIGVRVDAFRGLPPSDPREFLWDLFLGFDSKSTIELSATGDWGKKPRQLNISMQERRTTRVALDGEPRGTEERSTALKALAGEELVLNYSDEAGKTFTSRGWRFERQSVGGGVVLSNEGLESQQEKVAGRPVSVYIPARRRPESRDDAQRLGKILVDGDENDILQSLRQVDSRLKRLSIIPIRDVPVVHADIGLSRLVPLPLLGDGMARLLSLAVTFDVARNGLVLIDEVENGLHHTVMRKVWASIAKLARKYEVQVVATTHSDECVRSAHEAFKKIGPDDLRLHRLERANGEVRAATFDHRTLGAALEAGLEVR